MIAFRCQYKTSTYWTINEIITLQLSQHSSTIKPECKKSARKRVLQNDPFILFSLSHLALSSDIHTQRENSNSNSNSKTLFYKDCSLGSVKNLSNN